MFGIEKLLAKYLQLVDFLISLIPYPRVRVWKEFLLNPEAVVRKDNVPVWQRIVDIYAFVIIELLFFLALILANGLPPQILSEPAIIGYIVGGITLLFILPFPFVCLLYSLIELGVAKLLGGASGMKENFNASALPLLAMLPPLLPLKIVILLSVWIFLIAQPPSSWDENSPIFAIMYAVYLFLYFIIYVLTLVEQASPLIVLYLKFVALKAVHRLSPARALAATILPVFIFAAMIAAVAIIIYMLVLLLFGLALSGARFPAV